MKELSRLLGSVPGSVTMAVNDKAKALKAAGHDVIALAGAIQISTPLTTSFKQHLRRLKTVRLTIHPLKVSLPRLRLLPTRWPVITV